jgi:hypothetical protein
MAIHHWENQKLWHFRAEGAKTIAGCINFDAIMCLLPGAKGAVANRVPY